MQKPKRGEAFENIMRRRVEDGLKAREAEFRAAHRSDTDDQLLDHVRQCAEELGHSPNGCEVIGGSFIAERFGGWGKVLLACGLPKSGPPPKWSRRTPVKREYEYQMELYHQERLRRKQEKEQARAEKLKQGSEEEM